MPSCNVCNEDEENKSITKFIPIGLGILMFIAGFVLSKFNSDSLLQKALYIGSYIFIAYSVVFTGIKNVFKYKMLDEQFLMAIATIGAMIIGEYLEAVMVILLYKIGEFLQDLAVEKSKEKIQHAIDIREEYANIKKNGSVSRIKSEKLNIGDIIVVKNGEKVPVDGKLIQGRATLNTSLITGESKPSVCKVGDSVLSGSLNIGDVIELEVMKDFEDSTVSKIVDFIEKANLNKSKTEKYITRFSKIYTPVIVALAVVIAIISPFIFEITRLDAISRALIFLVISCPCALVISIPLSFFVGIGSASKKGIVIKGSNFLDLISTLDIVAFDKTGTLTQGNFKVSKIVSTSEMKEEEILKMTAYGECFSNHFIAKTIIESYGKEINHALIKDYSEIPGGGISVNIENKSAIIGSMELLKNRGIDTKRIENLNEDGTIVHLALDGTYKGYLVLADEIKEGSIYTIEKLKEMKIKTVMLTGDSNLAAGAVARKLNINEFHGKLLPIEKAKLIEEFKNQGNKVGFVGDGINDSPVITVSDVGIAMGSGAAIATEVANIVVMNDDPKSLIDLIHISRKVKKLIKENISFSLLIKFLFLGLSFFGISNMWMAIFADVGVALLTILNSLRAIKIKNK